MTGKLGEDFTHFGLNPTPFPSHSPQHPVVRSLIVTQGIQKDEI